MRNRMATTLALLLLCPILILSADKSEAPQPQACSGKAALECTASNAGQCCAKDQTQPAYVLGGVQAIAEATNYPMELRASGLHVKAFMKFTIGIDGKASRISMDRIYGNWSADRKLKQIELFRIAATQAIENLTFAPKVSAANKMVSTEMILPIEFYLAQKRGLIYSDSDATIGTKSDGC